MYKHNDLVLIAEKWLRKNGFPVVVSELKTTIREIPDAIGFRSNSSMMIECKCSMSDFYADFKKPERINQNTGVGNYRAYLAPKGVLKLDKIPQGWGFLEVDEKGRVHTVKFKKGNIWSGNDSIKDPRYLNENHVEYLHLSDLENERRILFSMLRRIV